jgi:hypothetical protein
MKLTCIKPDWAANPIQQITPDTWEQGVWDTLKEIAQPSFRVGRVVLRRLQRSGKTVRVVPWREPDPISRNQREGMGFANGRCPSGLAFAQAAPESSAADVQVRPDQRAQPGDAFVLFTAQDFRLPEEKADFTLLQELFHCLRTALNLAGTEDIRPPTEKLVQRVLQPRRQAPRQRLARPGREGVGRAGREGATYHQGGWRPRVL